MHLPNPPRKQFSWHPIGLIPLFCFQCGRLGVHELNEIRIRQLGGMRRKPEVPFGLEAHCPECHLRCPIDETFAAVATRNPPDDVREWTRKEFGDDCGILAIAEREEDIERGLASRDATIGHMIETILLVAAHVMMPRPDVPAQTSLVRRMVLWTIGAVLGSAAIFTLYVFWPTLGAKPAMHTLLLMPIWLGLWTVGCYIAWAPASQHDRQFKEMHAELETRLIASLGRMQVDGFDLRHAMQVALEVRPWPMQLVDADTLLMRMRTRSPRSGVAAAGPATTATQA